MNVEDAVQKLCKWRSVFAGWQLGTRSNDDPECQAVKDHREVTMLMRAELNALTRCLIDAKVCTQEQFSNQVGMEAEYLDKAYEKRFPGFKTNLDGVDIDVAEAFKTTKGWRP